MQKLLTKAILKKLAKYPLYSQENENNPMIICKFFNPCGSGTWYAMEFDGEDTFFGYAEIGQGFELGYFSLSELQSVKLRFGLRIERDIHFEPILFGDSDSNLEA